MKREVSLKRYSKIFILLGFMLVLTIIAPHSFPTIANLSNVLWSVSVIGIMVSGSIFAILVGGIDLSVGSMLALTGIIVVRIIRFFDYSVTGVLIGILAALLCGVLVGVVHGIIITKFKVPAFLITYATQSIISGISMILTNNKILGCLEPEAFTYIGIGKLLGLPVPVFIMAAVALISFYVLDKTQLGRYVYAVGGNPEASRLSGISDNGITMLAYIFSGLTAAIGGIVLASMTQQAMASTGSGYETEVITAAVIGGVSLAGGEGTVMGAIFGAVLVGLLNNGMNLMNVPSTHHGLVKGLVIITAVAVDIMGHQEKKKGLLLSLFRKQGGTVQ